MTWLCLVVEFMLTVCSFLHYCHPPPPKDLSLKWFNCSHLQICCKFFLSPATSVLGWDCLDIALRACLASESRNVSSWYCPSFNVTKHQLRTGGGEGGRQVPYFSEESHPFLSSLPTQFHEDCISEVKQRGIIGRTSGWALERFYYRSISATYSLHDFGLVT